MTDTYSRPPALREGVPTDSRTSVPAIVTYWLLAIWTGIIVGVFNLVLRGVTIDGILLSLVSGLIGTQTTLLVASVSFWVGATVGGKQANERLAKAQEVSNAALSKLAGDGSKPAGDVGDTPEKPLNVAVVGAAADSQSTA